MAEGHSCWFIQMPKETISPLDPEDEIPLW